MSVQVYLTISGLCMYVPGGAKDPSVLHVLMPSHRHRAAPDPDGRERDERLVEHRAVLVVDRKYVDHGEQPGGGEGTGDVDKCNPLGLDGCAVLVRGRAPGAPPPRVDPHFVVRLDSSANFPGVRHACIETSLDPWVHARLELRGAARPKYSWLEPDPGKPRRQCLVPPGGECRPGGVHPPRPMAEHVTWDLGPYDEDVLTLASVFDAVPDTKPPAWLATRLRPRNDRVELRIAYVLPSVLPSVCENQYNASGTGNAHFAMFYGLGAPHPGPWFEIQAEAGPELAPLGKGPLYPSEVCNSATADLAA